MALYHKLQGRKARARTYHVLGTTVHRGAQSDYEARLLQGELRSREQVLDEAGALFDEVWEKEDPWLDEEEAGTPRATYRELRGQAVKLSLAHHERIAPEVRPRDVERRLRAQVGGTSIELVGTLDVLEHLPPLVPGDPPFVRVRDAKTSKGKLGRAAAAASIQGQLYSFLVGVIDGTPVDSFVLDVMEKRRPAAYALEVPAPRTFDPLLLRIEKAARVIETGSFMPADPTGPSGWVCTEKFCGYWNECPFGRAGRVQFAMP